MDCMRIFEIHSSYCSSIASPRQATHSSHCFAYAVARGRRERVRRNARARGVVEIIMCVHNFRAQTSSGRGQTLVHKYSKVFRLIPIKFLVWIWMKYLKIKEEEFTKQYWWWFNIRHLSKNKIIIIIKKTNWNRLKIHHNSALPTSECLCTQLFLFISNPLYVVHSLKATFTFVKHSSTLLKYPTIFSSLKFKLPNGMANLFRLPSLTYSFPGYCNAINAMQSNVVFH